MHKNSDNKELFCVARRENRIRPDHDRVSFATAYHPAAEGPAGFEWGDASDAERFTLAELAKMLEPESGRGNGDYRLSFLSRTNYVRNGCSSPDEIIYIVPAATVDTTDARHLDPARYPITESELDAMGDDTDAFDRRCDECDVELAEDSSLTWDEILARVFAPADCPLVDADEARRIEGEGYSAEDSAASRVLARSDTGAVLYLVGSGDYAIESGPGDIQSGMLADEAAREWFA